MFCFFFNDTATTEIYTLSLHDALPISVSMCLARESGNLPPLPARRVPGRRFPSDRNAVRYGFVRARLWTLRARPRSEEHTSELQSRQYLVCRLLLEKKKNNKQPTHSYY